MDQVKEAFSGSRTYALGVFLIAYMAIETYAGREPDQNIIMGTMAGMGITLRMGMKKSEE